MRQIGSIDYISSLTSPDKDRKIELYEAIEHYKNGSGTAHVYILTTNRKEAEEVMNAWLMRNNPFPSPKKTKLHKILILHHKNHNQSTSTILTGPSLKLSDIVCDHIHLD